MIVKRNKLNEYIIKCVLNGDYPAYNSSFNGVKQYRITPDHVTLYDFDSSHQIPISKYTVEELGEMIANHVITFDQRKESSERKMKYLTEYIKTKDG